MRKLQTFQPGLNSCDQLFVLPVITPGRTPPHWKIVSCMEEGKGGEEGGRLGREGWKVGEKGWMLEGEENMMGVEGHANRHGGVVKEGCLFSRVHLTSAPEGD